MQAGREMDALIAEKIMGWARVGANWHTKPKHRPSLDRPGETYDEWDAKGPHDFLIPPDAGIHHRRKGVSFCGCEYGGEIPSYSTSIEAAWQVVEKLCGTYPGVHRRVEVIAIKHGGHVCLVEEGEEGDSQFEVTRHYIATASADTAPLAICLAALAAVGVEVA